MKLYCMQNPKGKMVPLTLATSKSECWHNSWNTVVDAEGFDFASKYWKRERALIRAACKLGWDIVEVRVVKVHKPYVRKGR